MLQELLRMIEEGGWGMYPTMLFGGLLLISALAYAIKPSRLTAAPVPGLLVVTVLAGCLGALIGIQTTVRYVVSNHELNQVFLVGLRESLQCPVMALLLSIPSMLIAIVGRGRQRWQEHLRATPAASPAPAREPGAGALAIRLG